ncbi:jg18883, partial [Pararge aegeria aegeria]
MKAAQLPVPVPQVPSEAPSVPPESPKPEQHATVTWTKVVGRKTKATTSAAKKSADATPGKTTYSGRTKSTKPPPSPKTAAVTITLTDGSTANYAEAMAAAKQRINLADCGISHLRQKKAITGGLILEVPGPDSTKKADALAERLRAALADMGVRIARPVKTGEIRVMDLDESITRNDIAAVISETGGCSQEEVKVGEIRLNPSRLGTAWVRCPITAFRKLADVKYLRVGWVSVRVRILAARQLQCFRCLEVGHVRKHCQNTIDRSLCCYCCGEQGHKARECEAKVPKCPVCADLGRPADHRLGSAKCNPPKKSTGPGKGNLNHCRAAQDLLQQCLVEWSVALAVVAEPYKVPNNPRWFGSVGNKVAIFWGGKQGDPPCTILEKGLGFVAVQWGIVGVVGCYISPNSGFEAYESYLDNLAACIRRCLPRPTIILGDFNAHSKLWGDKRDDRRGNLIQDWAAELNLQLLNQGSTSTCVRWQGESIVDLTWATPSASHMVSGWRVAEEVVTLSDHRHIVFQVTQRPSCMSNHRNCSPPLRWSLKKLNRDLLVAAAHVAAWPNQSQGLLSDPEEEAAWFRHAMISICDASMPRARQAKRKMIYWSSGDIERRRSQSCNV